MKQKPIKIPASKPRNPAALAAKMRKAGPMKSKTTHDDWTKALQDVFEEHREVIEALAKNENQTKTHGNQKEEGFKAVESSGQDVD